MMTCWMLFMKRLPGNYMNHREYIWTVVDLDKVVIPARDLGNQVLVEDKYCRSTYSKVRKGQNEASSLRVRFTALKAYIAFLQQRKIYGGMTRSQIMLEYVEG